MTEDSQKISGPRLVVARGETKGKVFKLEPGKNLVGRWDPDTGAFPEIDLEEEDVEAKVSRKHAVLELKDGKVILEDVGSLNGTYINRDNKLEPGVKHPLTHGDEIILGKVVCRFEDDDS